MVNALRELVRISNTVGRDSALVLGGFGNTSVKTADGKYMYIKASGTALKEMDSKSGWRRLCVNSVLAILKDKSIAKMSIDKREAKVTKALLLSCDDKNKKNINPSIESCFHAILDRCVMHLHPVAVLAYACAKNGRKELEELFKAQKPPPLWVPYANPGLELAKRIEKLTGTYKVKYGQTAPIIFLQNHGLVVTADKPETALNLVRKVIDVCGSKLKKPKAGEPEGASDEAISEAIWIIKKAFFDATGKRVPLRYFMNEKIGGFMAARAARQLCSEPALTLDELIISHGPPMWVEGLRSQTILNKLNAYIAAGRELPTSILIKPLGLFVTAGRETRLLVKNVTSNYLYIRSCAAKLGGIHTLTKQQQDFIAKYKKNS